MPWRSRAGCLVAEGPADVIVRDYLARAIRAGAPAGRIDVSQVPRKAGSGAVRVAELSYSSGLERLEHQPFPDGPLTVTFDVESDSERSLGSFALLLHDVHGTKLVNADALAFGRGVRLRRGENTVSFRIEQLHLKPGQYRLGWWLYDPLGETIFDWVKAGVNLEVVDDTAGASWIHPSDDGLVSCDFEVESEWGP